MGLIGDIFGVFFGGDRNAIRETAEIFRPNAENEAVRDAAREAAALAQFASEFALPRQGLFDRFIDGVNRLPRPMLALGTLGLFAAALIDPVWFAQRMHGVALVPEPLWWLMGAIVSFYFGARHQTKSHQYSKALAEALARTPEIARNIETIDALREESRIKSQSAPAASHSGNAALNEWRASRER